MNLLSKSLLARWMFALFLAVPVLVLVGCGEGSVSAEQEEAEDALDEASELENEANEDDGDDGGKRRRRRGGDEEEDEDE